MKLFILKGLPALLFLIVLCPGVFAQGFIVIDDPHIKAQQDRMVITSWGDFLPKPRYFLGVQTNIHFMRTWGWLAPSQNRSYRRGKDLRPLGPTGEQTQRMLLNAALVETSNACRQYTDSIRRTAINEMTYYTGLLSEVDPLWRLYYKAELKEVRNFDIQRVKNALNREEIQYLEQTRMLDWFEEQMTMFRERLMVAFKTDMDRGSRILAYHRILQEYRQARSKWDHHLNWANRMLAFKKKADSSPVLSPDMEFQRDVSSDADLMRKIIRKAKTSY
ncbi:hypothetical protein [Gaoshiqia sp. Z1-71]|uniref:hypothetical protein n=1 Tax=Gaoshiqia hydrogeniformans TaxID=3290090 RepID=UPI003BF8D214